MTTPIAQRYAHGLAESAEDASGELLVASNPRRFYTELTLVMRIRVVQRPSVNKIDGLPLDAFEPGQVYEMGNQLAAVFLAEGWGVPVSHDSPPPIEPFGPDDPYDSRRLYRKRTHTTGIPKLDRASNASKRRRRKSA